jgi:hypothetical protein
MKAEYDFVLTLLALILACKLIRYNGPYNFDITSLQLFSVSLAVCYKDKIENIKKC